jgi:hypothetical protein
LVPCSRTSQVFPEVYQLYIFPATDEVEYEMVSSEQKPDEDPVIEDGIAGIL